MNISQGIVLNLSAGGIPPRLRMVQGDSNTRTIEASLWDGAQPYAVPDGSNVMVRFRKPDGTGGLYDTTEGGSPITFDGNNVAAPVATQMLAVPGEVAAEMDIYGTGTGTAAEKLATFRFIVEVAPCVLPDAEIISSDYYNILSAQIAAAVAAGEKADAALAAANQAAAAAESAEQSKTAAAGSAASASRDAQTAASAKTDAVAAKAAAESAQEAAQASQTAAAGSASSAAENAQSAAQDAQDAAQDAEDAEAWAVGKRNGVDVPSTDPAYNNNAKYYKEQAQAVAGGEFISYGAPQSLTDAQQAQARDNIGAPAPYTPGDNISISGSVIATKAFPCNPSLLDNWYFPNPVNQRNGHVIPPKGAGHLYRDAACTLLISGGTIDAYRQVTPVSTGNYSYSIDGGVYYVKASDVVPGYTGIGYTIDRWKLAAWNANSIAMIVEADGVRLIGTSNSANSAQLQESTQLLSFATGAVVTASILVTALGANGASPRLFVCKSDGTPIRSSIIESVGLHTLTMVIPDDAGDSVMLAWGQHASLGGSGNTDMTVKAVKLELGSVQTLAHQDANGNWVLNEIPDYGEQLRRCQRYCYVLSDVEQLYTGRTYDNTPTKADAFIPIPVTMRTKPSVSFLSNPTVLKAYQGTANAGATIDSVYGATQNGIDVALTLDTALTVNAPLVLRIFKGKMLLSADL